MIKLYNGDCLIESDKIEEGSVDLILTDLPYGTMKDLNYKELIKCRGVDAFEWDNVIDIDRIFDASNRILRKNGRMILFAQQPFTTDLINHAISNMPFSYSMIWEKDIYGHALTANKVPLNYYEDILMFSKRDEYEGLHPLRGYGIMCSEFISKSRKERSIALGHRGSDHFLESEGKPLQFSLCTEKTYKQLIDTFSIDKMNGFKEYVELKKIDDKFKASFSSTFNLWEGRKHKSNILKYRKDYNGYHPTQKPVLLLEDLIKTFSNKGDLVVDLTMGSGSTGVACVNTYRKFIGIELDEEYYKIAENRINERISTIA